MKIDTIIVRDIEMRYARFGRGQKNLVIIPGLSFKPVTDSAEAVAVSYESFAEAYTIWLFDVRSNAPCEYSIEDMANDTVEIMKYLGIELADFFGASMGGMIVQYIGLNYPDLVNRMILASSMCRNNETSYATLGRWRELAAVGKLEELVELCVDDMYSEATLRNYRDILIEANSGISDRQITEFISRIDAVHEFDISNQLATIKCPVLVMGSEGDRVLGSQASKEIAAQLNCELYMYPDSFSHCVYDEAPDFKNRVHAFLD
ncbi:MAG: alpha/beta hydrolase [Clostridiales bacterium]|nr:alpha/beta hydrolase [Candidatus Crickella merdequi]